MARWSNALVWLCARCCGRHWPLAAGRLFTGQGEEELRVRALLAELAAQHSTSMATVAYAWLLRHPSRPWPVTGSQRHQALREAVAALMLPLSTEDWYRVWQASVGHEVRCRRDATRSWQRACRNFGRRCRLS